MENRSYEKEYLTPPRGSLTKRILTHRLFYIGLAVALGLIFLLQNNRPVTIDFFFWTLASANLLILLLVFFALGALSGFFGREIVKYRFRNKERAQNKARKKTSFSRPSEV